MENTKYGRRREGRWTPIRAKAQDTRANPNSWETHLARKRWDIGLLRALSPRIIIMMMIMMMMMMMMMIMRMMMMMMMRMMVSQPFRISNYHSAGPKSGIRRRVGDGVQIPPP